ncbi:ferredoxin-NADP reductase [Melghirimyces profundicolus]|uniref:Ferredoxin-NADP reductase n=1 Tax=Melghirimyces profundicolus TaxID=1242148 RepID=A0A2T6C8D9_9BACL|nr:PDR/VanB family oxidoreductase [Melghirimyces profundicolus]PTX64580.1 ferredoxin-NADP reductase [Melghirimyces profundicolus]
MSHPSTIRVVVGEIHRETPSIKRFILLPAEGSSLPAFGGGAHVTTILRTEGSVIQRPYSLCGDPHRTDSYQIAVRLRENSRGGSHYWHHRVREGTELEIGWPVNRFPLSRRAKHHVLCAAGIGITPFLSMMADLEAKGASFELHYAAPSRSRCAFYSRIRSRYGDRCRFYFSGNGERMTPEPLLDQRIGTHLYFCGPGSMVRQFSGAAVRFGYPEKSIHWELFSPPVVCDPEPFEVELKKSGRLLHVPKDRSLLDVLLRAGVKAPHSCRMGRCGTCAVSVLEGEVDHRDEFLTGEEKRAHHRMLTCVSRAQCEKLVLDL